MVIIHMPIWDAIEDEEYAPDGPPPTCKYCGRKYAIPLPRGSSHIPQCGVCYREYLDGRAERKQRKAIIRRLTSPFASPQEAT